MAKDIGATAVKARQHIGHHREAAPGGRCWCKRQGTLERRHRFGIELVLQEAVAVGAGQRPERGAPKPCDRPCSWSLATLPILPTDRSQAVSTPHKALA